MSDLLNVTDLHVSVAETEILHGINLKIGRKVNSWLRYNG